MIRLDVLGTPAPKGSARAVNNRHTGRAQLLVGGSSVNAAKIKQWHAAVRDVAIAAYPEQVAPLYVKRPIEVAIIFRLARPSGHWSKSPKRPGLLPSAPLRPTVKPDIDKLARCTLDALTGILFDDDSSVVELNTSKEYAAPGLEGATILVREWQER